MLEQQRNIKKEIGGYFGFMLGILQTFVSFVILCVSMIVWNVLKAAREFTESREKLTTSSRGRFQCHQKLWAWFYYHSSVCAVWQRVFRNITTIKRKFNSIEEIPSHKCLLCLHCIAYFWLNFILYWIHRKILNFLSASSDEMWSAFWILNTNCLFLLLNNTFIYYTEWAYITSWIHIYNK